MLSTKILVGKFLRQLNSIIHLVLCYNFGTNLLSNMKNFWVQSKFAFPRDPTTRKKIRHNTIKKLGDLWRNYKCELKAKYYDESRKRKEILTRVPLSVNRAQFVRLVDYWRSDEAKVYLVLQNYIVLFILFGKSNWLYQCIEFAISYLIHFFYFLQRWNLFTKIGTICLQERSRKNKDNRDKKK